MQARQHSTSTTTRMRYNSWEKSKHANRGCAAPQAYKNGKARGGCCFIRDPTVGKTGLEFMKKQGEREHLCVATRNRKLRQGERHLVTEQHVVGDRPGVA